VALASATLFCVVTNPTPGGCRVVAVGTLLRPDMSRSTAEPGRFSRMFGVQRSSVKLIDRTLHGVVVRPMEHDTGEIITNAFHVTNKAALGGGLDPSVRRVVSRRTQPFPEPAPRRGRLAELEVEALLLSDPQTSPSEAQCAHPGIPTHRGVSAARFC
jgi:hypothetical protein